MPASHDVPRLYCHPSLRRGMRLTTPIPTSSGVQCRSPKSSTLRTIGVPIRSECSRSGDAARLSYLITLHRHLAANPKASLHSPCRTCMIECFSYQAKRAPSCSRVCHRTAASARGLAGLVSALLSVCSHLTKRVHGHRATRVPTLLLTSPAAAYFFLRGANKLSAKVQCRGQWLVLEAHPLEVSPI